MIAGAANAEQFQQVGEYEVHYIVIPTLSLRAEIADRYGVTRSDAKALLNVSILRHGTQPTAAVLEGTATNLLGQIQSLQFQEVREGPAIYYLALVRHSDEEMFRFKVDLALPDGQTGRLEWAQSLLSGALMRIVLASRNDGKLAELQALLAPLGVVLESQAQHGVPSPDETGLTFLENALIKARTVTAATGLPAIADDSGLVVPALGGAPGILSARYAGEHGDDRANNARLVRALDAIEDRRAYFLLRHGLSAPRTRSDPAHRHRRVARHHRDRGARQRRLRLRSAFLSAPARLHRCAT